jgi:phage regulator Rha-like protein
LNNLTTLTQMTSTEIALVIGKRHSDVMRDIRDEAQKLENGGMSNERKFALVEYTDGKGEKRPCYSLSKEGVLQLAARYDAVVRAKLIDMVMKQSDPFKTLSPELKAIIVTDKKVQQLETKVDQLDQKVETQITVTFNQQNQIQKSVSSRVIELLGGKDTQDYKELKATYFAQLHRDLRDRLGVPSYRDILKKDYNNAINYICAWLPRKGD